MFYVGQVEFTRLSGRTRQGIVKAVNTKRLVEERSPSDAPIYDIDAELTRRYLGKLPNNMGAEATAELRAYQKSFTERRADGMLRCAKTGEVDLMGEMTEMFLLDDEHLDRKKKTRDIEHKEMQIEKMKKTLQAMEGDLIERQYVTTYLERYLGTMHTNLLNRSGGDFCDKLYDLAHVHKNRRDAVTEIQRIVSGSDSEVIKEAIKAMEKRPL